MDRRDWERRNADIALYETGRQLESHWMELYQANQLSDQAQKEKSWLCEEMGMKNRASHQDRQRDCQEIAELRRNCCMEAVRAQQLKLDELPTQQKENFSTVNQLLAQIQDSHDKVNSLNDAKDFL